MYNILFQNNGSREFFFVSGLTNVSTNELYLRFDDIDLPEGMEDGEYTYAVFTSKGEDEFEIAPKTPILDTILTADGQDIVLKDLCPILGLMRVGAAPQTNIYDGEENNKTFYYEV